MPKHKLKRKAEHQTRRQANHKPTKQKKPLFNLLNYKIPTNT